MIDYSDFTFPKPGDMETVEPWIQVFPDGREILNQKTIAGKKEYKRRTLEMRGRQRDRCCLEGHAPMCPGYLKRIEATFEHEGGRGHGGGKRDDRTQLPDGTWINGAAHGVCNNWKGSKRIPYNAAKGTKQGGRGVRAALPDIPADSDQGVSIPRDPTVAP